MTGIIDILYIRTYMSVNLAIGLELYLFLCLFVFVFFQICGLSLDVANFAICYKTKAKEKVEN